MHIADRTKKQRQKQKPAPKILNLLEQIQEGIHPQAISIPDYNLFLAPYNGGKEWRTHYRDENNKRQQIQTKTGDLKKARKIVESELIAEVYRIAQLWDLLPKEFTLSKLFDHFISRKIKLNRAKNTLAVYNESYDHLMGTFGDFIISDFNLLLAQEYVDDGWINDQRERISWVSTETIKKHVRSLKAVWNSGIKYFPHLISTNVWGQVELPLTVLKHKPTLTVEQLKIVYDKIGCSTYIRRRLQRLLILSAIVGTRIDEMLHIRKSCIDRDKKTLSLENHLDFRVKSREGRVNDIWEGFIDLVDQQIKDNEKKGRFSEYIYPNDKDGIVSYSTVHPLLVLVLKEVKLYKKYMGFHTLRGLSGTGMIDNGASVRYIQGHYGHSNIKQTEEYLGVSDNQNDFGKQSVAKWTDKVMGIVHPVVKSIQLEMFGAT